MDGMLVVWTVALLIGVLSLVLASVGFVVVAAIVVLRYQRQVSFPLELVLRQGAKDPFDYATRATQDAAAAGRGKKPDALSSDGDEPAEGQVMVPTSQLALADLMPPPGQ